MVSKSKVIRSDCVWWVNPTPPWCRIYVSVNWASIGSGYGLPPVRRQAITWTNADLLSIGPLGTNCSEVWIKVQNLLFIKMYVKMSSAEWLSCCSGGDELTDVLKFIFHLSWPHSSLCPLLLSLIRPSPMTNRKYDTGYWLGVIHPTFIAPFFPYHTDCNIMFTIGLYISGLNRMM